MTDLEMMKRCAEAMGYQVEPYAGGFRLRADGNVTMGVGVGKYLYQYDPLHDDAQCMALVKRFRMDIFGSQDGDVWGAAVNCVDLPDTVNADLNRAIVQCVASMQQAKG